MRRERLTPQRIDRFICAETKSQDFLWDSVVPHLAVRATIGGAKSFTFESKLNRKTIRRTIGDVREWSVDDARIEARRLQTMIDQGTDPREVERKKAAEDAAVLAEQLRAKNEFEIRQKYTLGALCAAYVASLKEQGKAKSAAEAASSFKCHVTAPFPQFSNLPASEVTPVQVATMVRKVYESGKERAAGVLRSYLSAAFNAARKAPFDPRLSADLIPFNIVSNPVDAIPTIAVKAGDRVLSRPELRCYMNNLSDALTDQALLLALLSGGQRIAQLLRAKVTDYDEANSALRLWDGKGKRSAAREHILPLAPKAAAIVRNLIERAKSKNSVWLFSTHGAIAMTFTTPGKRVAEISMRMGGEPFDLRDIRRTCETMLASMGIPRETRAHLLSHGISGVQAAHYDRHTYFSEKQRALTAWEAKLSDVLASTPSEENVISLLYRTG